MRLPKLRFSTRGMLIAVALAAVLIYSWREYRAWIARHTYSDPLSGSEILARPGESNFQPPFVPGQTIPMTILYDFKLSKPRTGVSCLALGIVWLEDIKTKMPVASYSFDALLTGGGRESCSGTIVWDAAVPRPGKYYLRYRRYHQEAGSEIAESGSYGASLCEFLEERKP